MGIHQPSPSMAVWIITFGETVTKENFEKCSRAVDKSSVPKHSYLKGETAWRYIIGCLLPQTVMRKFHIPRSGWDFFKTKVVEATGKPYISLKTNHHIPQAMGFSMAETGTAMAFAFSMGPKHQVLNVGVGIHATKPSVSTSAFIQSHLHELTAREEKAISLVTHDEATSLRRLNIILCIKDAYIKAIGQPVGFDLSRIECIIPKERLFVDGQELTGWEIRLFQANLRTDRNIPHLQYQVAVAVFRGYERTVFSWARTTEELDSFVTFYDVSDIVSAVPRLGEYDNSALPPLEHIPLSGRSSMASISEKKKIQQSYLGSHSVAAGKYELDVKLPINFNANPLPPAPFPNNTYPTSTAYSQPPPQPQSYQPAPIPSHIQPQYINSSSYSTRH